MTLASENLGADPVGQLAEEFVGRYRRGERPALAEYTAKFPELAGRIREVFPLLVLMEEAGSGVDSSPEASPSGASASPNLAGRRLERLGDYRILKEVGRGGMGVVYEAVQESLGRHVALKLLPYNTLIDPKHLERFRREAQAAARLHHSNIVPVFGVGEHDGIHYYAMQFIQGEGLDAVLEEVRHIRKNPGAAIAGARPPRAGPTVSLTQGLLTGQFAAAPAVGEGPVEGLAPAGPSAAPATASVDPVARPPSDNGPASANGHSEITTQVQGQYYRSVARLGVQVAEALAYAHQHGILHRDIKPANLLLDTAGTVWITDFGLAKTEGSAELTHTGDIVGTLRYMAPERIRNQADPRSDVYSLGMTLYELLTLQPAFTDTDRARLMERIVREEPPAPRALERGLPRDLETIVLKAIAKEPARRYLSAEALAEDLRRFLLEQPVQARRIGNMERTWRWCRRNPVVAALSAGLLLVLFLGLAGIGWKWQEADARADAEAVQRARAEHSEATANNKLWQAYLAEAEAQRRSRTTGQRFQSLKAIRKALQLPVPPGRSLRELRNAAASALALPDVEVVQEWQGLPLGTESLCFDGALVRYARADPQGIVSVRRVADDSEIAQTSGPRVAAGVALSPDGLFIAVHHHATKQLKVWQLTTPKLKLVYHDANMGVSRVLDFSPDNQLLLYCPGDGRIRIITLANGRVKRWRIKGTNIGGTPLRPGGPLFRPDSRQIMFRSEVDGHETLQVCDVGTGTVQANLRHPALISYHAWHPAGRMIATCCNDYRIRLWDTATWQLTLVLEGHKDFGAQCVFTPDGNRLLSNDWSYLLRVWDVQTGRQLFATPMTFDMHHFGPDGRLAVRDGHKVKLIRIARGNEFRTLARRAATGPGAYATTHGGVALRPDGRLLAITTAAGTCALVDPVSGAELAVIPVQRTIPLRFEASRALLTFGLAGLCRWPVRQGPGSGRCRLGPPLTLCPSRTTEGVASTADGRILAIPNFTQGALVLHRDCPGQPLVLGPQEDVRFCAVSPDGRWVATGNHTNTQGVAAKVWDASRGKLVKDLPMSGDCWVGFSPDSKWLVTTAGGCRLWAVGTWEKGPSVGGGSFAFSPDSQVLAVGDEPGVIRLLEPATGREFVRLASPEQTRLWPQCFTPDGTQLIALGIESQALHVWDLRLIRRQLAAMGLDWDAPPYPPAKRQKDLPPLRVEVDLGPKK